MKWQSLKDIQANTSIQYKVPKPACLSNNWKQTAGLVWLLRQKLRENNVHPCLHELTQCLQPVCYVWRPDTNFRFTCKLWKQYCPGSPHKKLHVTSEVLYMKDKTSTIQNAWHEWTFRKTYVMACWFLTGEQGIFSEFTTPY